MTMTRASSEYFDKIAGSWDQISAGYFGPTVRDSAINKAWLRPEMAVADIGSGTGFMAAGLAPLVKQVYVVDGSPAMLEVARKNLVEFNNVEYHQADGSSLPFPDESLDAVFANMYLHHAADPLAAIQEMVRVLRPGGRLVITDMDEHPYSWLKDEMSDEWQGFKRDHVYSMFKEAGLVNIIVDCTGQSCCAESSNPALLDSHGRQAKISVFVAAGTRRMVMRDAVQENYSAIAQSGSSCCSPSSDDSSQSGCCSDDSSSTTCCGSGGLNDFVTFASGYAAAELSAAPKEAADFSLGCGNPLAMAALQPGEVVLDIGSGGGLDSFLAAQRVGPTGQVIGVDMTPAMLERARGTAARMGYPQCGFPPGLCRRTSAGK